MLTTLKNALLSFAGLFGYEPEVTLEEDAEAAIAKPTEAGFETIDTDVAAVVEHLDKNVPAPVVEACATLGIALIGFVYAPSVKGATVIGGEILTELPKVDPKWSKITPEHAQAFVQALSDIESDYGL